MSYARERDCKASSTSDARKRSKLRLGTNSMILVWCAIVSGATALVIQLNLKTRSCLPSGTWPSSPSTCVLPAVNGCVLSKAGMVDCHPNRLTCLWSMVLMKCTAFLWNSEPHRCPRLRALARPLTVVGRQLCSKGILLTFAAQLQASLS